MPGRILPIKSNIRADAPEINWRKKEDDSPGFMEVFRDAHTVLSSPLTAPIAGGLKSVFGSDPESLRTRGAAGAAESDLTKGAVAVGAGADMVGPGAQDILSGDFGPNMAGAPASGQLQISPEFAPKPSYQLTEPVVSQLNPEHWQPGPFGLSQSEEARVSKNLKLPNTSMPFADGPFDSEGAGLGLGGAIPPVLDRPDPVSLPTVLIDSPAGYGGPLKGSPLRSDEQRFFDPISFAKTIARGTKGEEETFFPGAAPGAVGYSLEIPGLMQEIAAQELSPEAAGTAPAPELPPAQPAPERQQEPTPDLIDKYKGMTAMQAARAALEEGAIMRADLDLTGIENWSPEQIAAAIPDANKSQVPLMTQWAERNTEPESLLDWISGASERKTRKLLASKKPNKGISQSEIISLAAKIQDLRSKEGEDPLRRSKMGADIDLTRARTKKLGAETTRLENKTLKQKNRLARNPRGVRTSSSNILGAGSFNDLSKEGQAAVRGIYLGIHYERPSKNPADISDAEMFTKVRAALNPTGAKITTKLKKEAFKVANKYLRIKEPTQTPGKKWADMSESDQDGAVEHLVSAHTSAEPDNYQKNVLTAGAPLTSDNARVLAKSLINRGLYKETLKGLSKRSSTGTALKTQAGKDRAAARSTLRDLAEFGYDTPAKLKGLKVALQGGAIDDDAINEIAPIVGARANDDGGYNRNEVAAKLIRAMNDSED